MYGNEDEPEPTEFKTIETAEQRRQNELRRALLLGRENYRMFFIGLLLGIVGNVFVSTSLEVIKPFVPDWYGLNMCLFILSSIAIALIFRDIFSVIQDYTKQIQTYLPPLPGTEEQTKT